MIVKQWHLTLCKVTVLHGLLHFCLYVIVSEERKTGVKRGL